MSCARITTSSSICQFGPMWIPRGHVRSMSAVGSILALGWMSMRQTFTWIWRMNHLRRASSKLAGSGSVSATPT
jgi:hypothetical protein